MNRLDELLAELSEFTGEEILLALSHLCPNPTHKRTVPPRHSRPWPIFTRPQHGTDITPVVVAINPAHVACVESTDEEGVVVIVSTGAYSKVQGTVESVRARLQGEEPTP